MKWSDIMPMGDYSIRNCPDLNLFEVYFYIDNTKNEGLTELVRNYIIGFDNNIYIEVGSLTEDLDAVQQILIKSQKLDIEIVRFDRIGNPIARRTFYDVTYDGRVDRETCEYPNETRSMDTLKFKL
jgi:hypothetical protein